MSEQTGFHGFKSREALADAAAALLIQRLRDAVKIRGSATLAVPGGSTPGPIFDHLAHAKLPWERITVTLVDERFVPPDHPDSNARLVRDRLLRDEAAGARFIPLVTDTGDLDLQAAAAAARLEALEGPFDAVLLGMGSDGHIASLFPHSPVLQKALGKAAPKVLPVPAGANGTPPPQPRLTLTFYPMHAAQLCVLVASGEDKLRTLLTALRSEAVPSPPIRTLATAARALWIGGAG